MLTRQEQFYKWSFFGTAVLLLRLLFSLTLRDVTILGVSLFLPPVVVGVVASLEGVHAGTIFALTYGVLCDLVLSGTFPCVYTISFTLAALLCAALAKSVLQPGVLCSIAATLLSFAVLDAFQMIALRFGGRAEAGVMLSLAVREMAVSSLLLLAVHPVMSFLHRKFTI